MTTRKRAPLVYRPSNTEAVSVSSQSSDIKGLCKQLMSTIHIAEVEALIIDISEVIGDGVSDSILRLIASKVAKHKVSKSSQEAIMRIIGTVDKPHTNPLVFPMVRWMVKLSRPHRLLWPQKNVTDRPALMFLEMVAWDSVSDGQINKFAIAQEIFPYKHKFSGALEFVLGADWFTSDRAMRVSISLVRAVSGDDPEKFLREAVSLIPKIDPETRTGAIAISMILNCGVWTSRLLGLDELTGEFSRLENVGECGTVVRDQVTMLTCLLDPGTVELTSMHSRLGKLINVIATGKSINGEVESDSVENRHEMALVNYVAAVHSVNAVNKVVFGLNALHCLRWNSRKEESQSTGTEGLLSILYADVVERVVNSVVISVPPLARIFLALDAVRITAEAFIQIGYLPGASWLLLKGIDFSETYHQPLVKRFTGAFKQQLRTLHIESPTAIRDEVLDYGKFQEVDSENGTALNKSLSLGERLCALRSVVLRQHILQSSESGSHIKRLHEVVSHSSELPGITPREKSGTWIQLELTDKDELSASMGLGGLTVFDEPICEGATSKILKYISRLSDIMSRNKDDISTRLEEDSHSKLFWEQRLQFDDEFGVFLSEIQCAIFSAEFVPAASALITKSGVVELILPDLLMSLPIEALPFLRDSICLRSVGGIPNPAPLSHVGLRGSFVVNPNGDCRATQDTVLPRLEAVGWRGHSGSPTLSDSEFSSLLGSSDVFLFSGHGGGEKHWSGSAAQRLCIDGKGPAPAVALLMGCSSARPYGDHAAPFCTPYHYLVGGSRIVVGTLWDVLGRELDRMTLYIIDELRGSNNVEELLENLPRIVKQSQSKCKLKHMSAASIVMYTV